MEGGEEGNSRFNQLEHFEGDILKERALHINYIYTFLCSYLAITHMKAISEKVANKMPNKIEGRKKCREIIYMLLLILSFF